MAFRRFFFNPHKSTKYSLKILKSLNVPFGTANWIILFEFSDMIKILRYIRIFDVIIRNKLPFTREEAEVWILTVSMFRFLPKSKTHCIWIFDLISQVIDVSGGKEAWTLWFFDVSGENKSKKPFLCPTKRSPLVFFQYCEFENLFKRESLTLWSTLVLFEP